jgi:beta-N-acetylhexosaminidase
VRILIDQEGGRISRLNPMYWRVGAKTEEFGELFEIHPDAAYQAVYDNALLISNDLLNLGINVNCAPIADVPSLDSHPVIGDRAFSAYPEVTANLCLAMIQGLQDMGITPVLKHFPGHGRATVDSHENLPVVSASKNDLYDVDFECFKKIITSMNHTLKPLPWGMTAHVVYKAIDDQYPATFSSKVIDNIIRGYMDFQGFLVSDCLTMNALSGGMGQRAENALKAGCDAVLHCNGNIDEMIDVAAYATELDDHGMERLADSIPKKNHQTIDTVALESSVKKSMDLLSSAPTAKRI